MPSVQIKNVPDEVHRVLARRADAAGQSLQEYLLALLTRETEMPTVAEFVERMEKLPPICGRSSERKGMSAADVIRELRGPLPEPPVE